MVLSNRCNKIVFYASDHISIYTMQPLILKLVIFSCVIFSLSLSYVERFPKAGETLCGKKFVMGCGGKGANQCIMSAKLGAKTAMIGCVGFLSSFFFLCVGMTIIIMTIIIMTIIIYILMIIYIL